MKKCIVCGYSYHKEHGVSLHEIPSGPIRDKWFEVISRPNVQAMSTVCGRHFRDEDYRNTPQKRRFLLPSAVPSLHMDPSDPPPFLGAGGKSRGSHTSSILPNRPPSASSYCMPPLKTYASAKSEMKLEVPSLLMPLPSPHDSPSLSQTVGALSMPPPIIALNELSCQSAAKDVLREIQIKPEVSLLSNEHSYSIQHSSENEFNNSVGTQTVWSNFQDVLTLHRMCESQKTEKRKLEQAKAVLEKNLKTWTEKNKKLRAERKKLLRSQFKCKQLDDRVGALKLELKSIMEDPYHKALLKLKEDAADTSNLGANFLLEQIKLYQSKKAHYSEESLQESSIWFHKGPKAYEHVRAKKLLTLPSESTLKRYLGPASNISGVTELIKEKLKAQLNKLKASDQHVSLFVDEMEVTKPLHSNIQDDLLAGTVTANKTKKFLEEREVDNTDQNLVLTVAGQVEGIQENVAPTDQSLRRRMVAFVLVGLTVTFQIPCAYHFCNDVNAFDLSNMVKSVVRDVEEVGYRVFRVVANSRALTSSMFHYLGGGSLPAVKHPVDPLRKLFVSFDNNDILKRIRNNLMNQAMIGCTEQTKKAVVIMQESIEHIETMNPAQYFICKHMKRKEVKSTNMNRAVQVFSGPVVTALENLKKVSTTEHLATVKFLEMLQKWQLIHNILNGQQNIKNLEQVMFVTTSDERIQFLQQTFPQFLNSMREGPNTRAKEVLTCEIYEALVLSSSAAVQSIEYLIKTFNTFPPLPDCCNSNMCKAETEETGSASELSRLSAFKQVSTKNVSPKRTYSAVISKYPDEPQPKKGLCVLHHNNWVEADDSLQTGQLQTVLGCEEVIHPSQNEDVLKQAVNTVETESQLTNMSCAESLQSSILYTRLLGAGDSQQRTPLSEPIPVNELCCRSTKFCSSMKSSRNNLVIIDEKRSVTVQKEPAPLNDYAASEMNLKLEVSKHRVKQQRTVKHGLVRVGQSSTVRTPNLSGLVKSPSNKTIRTTFQKMPLVPHQGGWVKDSRLPEKTAEKNVLAGSGKKVLVLKKLQSGS